MEGNLSLMYTTILTLTLVGLSGYYLWKHTDKIEKRIDSIIDKLTKPKDKEGDD